MNRTGSVLIIVSGIAGLLAALSLAFLSRMRADAEEMDQAMRAAQARIMLMAACTYVQEASRLGYHRPIAAEPLAHREAYGWIDVRGKRSDTASDAELIGPRSDDWDGDGAYDPCFSDALVDRSVAGGPADRPAWPAIGGVIRAPMHVPAVPPCASAAMACYNPMLGDVANPGWAYLSNPDPEPALSPTWPRTVSWQSYRDGDPTPRGESVGLAWFRVRRDSAATFTVTVGAGASRGWRDFDEIPVAEREAFAGDRALFDEIVRGEMRAWYRIEWSGAVASMDYHMLQHHAGNATGLDHYLNWSQNASHSGDNRSQMHARNPVGTIRWIQRLRQAPSRW